MLYALYGGGIEFVGFENPPGWFVTRRFFDDLILLPELKREDGLPWELQIPLWLPFILFVVPTAALLRVAGRRHKIAGGMRKRADRQDTTT